MKNLEIIETEKYLLTLIKEEINENKKVRLEALLCKKLNPKWSIKKIADTLGANRRTVERWFELYHQGGLKQMGDVKRKGSRLRKILSDAQQKEIKVAILEGKIKTYQEARVWILNRYEIRLSYKSVVMFLLKQMNLSLATRVGKIGLSSSVLCAMQ